MDYKQHRVSPSGLAHMAASTLAIAGLARDCGGKLKSNINWINTLRSYFKSSVVVVVENGSMDGTRPQLAAWAKSEPGIHILNGNPLVPSSSQQTAIPANPFYSLARIQKLASLRNQYISYLADQNLQPDYLLVLDFDVDRVSLSGILDSFERHTEWNVVSAYGYSCSPLLKERYHDSFALVPLGEENQIKTEKSIKSLQSRFRLKRSNTELVPVHAAYGGISLYKINGLSLPLYQCRATKDPRVEAECEHVQFCRFFAEKGGEGVFINPRMRLRYQTIGEAISRKITK